MTTEQFDEFINIIEQLGRNDFSWVDYRGDLAVSLISAIIAAIVAAYVAWYQVKKSKEHQEIQRIEELKNQKLFMIQELKLKSTEKILKSTTSVNRNLTDMTTLGRKKYETYLKKRGSNYTKNSSEMTEVNVELQQKFDGFENYLSNLFTCVSLFDIENTQIDIVNLRLRFYDFYAKCFDADLYKSTYEENPVFGLELELYSEAQLFIKSMNDIDNIVRKEQIKLIESM